ncbi:MAG: hypothetical protein Q9M39_02375 [Sulfurovum sp.]|nr:hypothetical protein [Sulfurovum sp.]
MLQKKNILLWITGCTTVFYLTACGTAKVTEPKSGYRYSGVYFGTKLSYNFKKGIRDGCTTSKGNYKKSHTRFNDYKDYKDGWFLGRNRCKHLLVIDTEIEKNSSE